MVLEFHGVSISYHFIKCNNKTMTGNLLEPKKRIKNMHKEIEKCRHSFVNNYWNKGT